MYTEVGEQMAEQNILNGNQKQLEQIIGDIKEHNVKKDRLEKLEESVKDISKELDNARKEADIEFKKARNELEDAKIKNIKSTVIYKEINQKKRWFRNADEIIEINKLK